MLKTIFLTLSVIFFTISCSSFAKFLLRDSTVLAKFFVYAISRPVLLRKCNLSNTSGISSDTL